MNKKQVIRMINFIFWNTLSSLIVMGGIMSAIDGSSKYPAIRLLLSFMIYMIMTVSMAERRVGYALMDACENVKSPKLKFLIRKPQGD